MIAVTQERDNIYTVEFAEPELSWIKEVAKGMGMNKSTVLAASVTKGLEHYFDMIHEIELHNNKESQADGNKH